jgi:hypothetical protein
MVKRTFGQKIRDTFLLVPTAMALSGMAVLMYQTYFWMSQGYWKPIGSRLLLDRVVPTRFFQWLDANSWPALDKVVSWIFDSPLALFLLVSGLVVILLISKTLSLFSRSAKKGQKRSWRG